jgi:hypothetical protein
MVENRLPFLILTSLTQACFSIAPTSAQPTDAGQQGVDPVAKMNVSGQNCVTKDRKWYRLREAFPEI